MKTAFPKLATAISALALSFLMPASAWAFTFNATLGPSPTATDVVQFTCPPGTVRAVAQLRDIVPAALPLIQVKLFKPTPAPAILPAAQALQEGMAPIITRAGGSGIYWAFYSKTAVGPEGYQSTLTCRSASGAMLPFIGPALLTQNQ
jgi:hypothetical protein